MSRRALLAVLSTLGVILAGVVPLHPASAKPGAASGVAQSPSAGPQLAAPDRTLAAGLAHTCALTPDGKVKCWGSNKYGQLGNGDRDRTPTPTPAWVLGVSTATAITAAGKHSCALLKSGRVKCWGVNGSGELGNGSLRRTVRATKVRGVHDAVAVSAGPHHTCALLSGGGIRCWGRNGNDELGNDDHYPDSLVAVPVKGIAKAVAVAAGGRHTCAVLSDGKVKCWGRNTSDQLGTATKRKQSAKPVTVKGITNATGIAAGAEHTCVITSVGQVLCWGDNTKGQLGASTSPKPLRVSKVSHAVSLSAGATHTCAVLKNGKIKCWGSNSLGELGAGTTGTSGGASAVRGIRTATEVSAGGQHTCARLSGTEIRCWGDNRDSELGHEPSPVPIPGITSATAIAAGRDHTCVLLSGGTVACLGANTKGQLGNGSEGQETWRPTPVAGLSNAVALAAGLEHACAVLSDGTTKCWGDNSDGQLGTGTYADSATPQPVVGLTDAVGITAASAGPDTGGGGHTCALRANGTVMCWGSNLSGELGNGKAGPEAGSPTPVPVTGITDATAISAAWGNTCALLSDGSLRCWGDNTYGQLGTGTAGTPSSTPTAVSNITTATGLGVGLSHVCARLADGTARCWGGNFFGQLGTGTSGWTPGGFDSNPAAASTTPVPVSGVSTAGAVTAGSSHTCALLSDGSVHCWGLNQDRQVDANDPLSSYGGYDYVVPTPKKVPGITTGVAVVAGTRHTCALLAAATAVCWGKDYHGAAGNHMPYMAPWPVRMTDP